MELLLGEIDASGEHTTADETVDLIEAVFTWFGCLWIAEYLHAGAFDQRINATLVGMLANRDDGRGARVAVGRWAAIGSTLRAAFVSEGRATVVEGLKSFDYGSEHDPHNVVSTLIRYRNAFAHGTMQSAIDDIRHHRELVEDLLLAVPALVDEAVRFDVDGSSLVWNGAWERAGPADSGNPSLCPS